MATWRNFLGISERTIRRYVKDHGMPIPMVRCSWGLRFAFRAVDLQRIQVLHEYNMGIFIKVVIDY